ncbi:MAG: acyl carrier protein [Clostridia bacterium]|nr:acyl carrier protein [Clostridia bacterium]
MRNEILNKILEVINVRFGENEGLTFETTFSDIDGWDSLSNVVFIQDLEKHFGVSFTFDEIFSFENLGQIVDSIEERIG